MQPESQPLLEAAGALVEDPTYDRTWIDPDLILVNSLKVIGNHRAAGRDVSGLPPITPTMRTLQQPAG